MKGSGKASIPPLKEAMPREQLNGADFAVQLLRMVNNVLNIHCFLLLLCGRIHVHFEKSLKVVVLDNDCLLRG
jgi:hypothetical protein